MKRCAHFRGWASGAEPADLDTVPEPCLLVLLEDWVQMMGRLGVLAADEQRELAETAAVQVRRCCCWP